MNREIVERGNNLLLQIDSLKNKIDMYSSAKEKEKYSSILLTDLTKEMKEKILAQAIFFYGEQLDKLEKEFEAL